MADPQQYTSYIDPEECIGLSLDTINQNFLNLDVSVGILSAASLGWVNSNSSIITQAYTWAQSTSVDINTVNTWYSLNSGLNYNTTNWVSQYSAINNQSISLFDSISSTTINTNTWVRRNSSALVQIIDTRAFTKNSRNSVYPVSVVYRKNYVASTANYSGMFTGIDNWLHGDYSVICGGTTNTLSADKSVLVGGFGSTVKGETNAVVGGVAHSVSGVDNFIGGGNTNAINFKNNVIGGGLRNTILNDYCGILGGINNKALHSNTFILGSNITTVIPNATYVNSLVIKDIPPLDNGTGSLLLRDNNGVIRTKLVPNLTNVEPLFSWVKSNSSSFVSTAAIESVSSGVIHEVLEILHVGSIMSDITALSASLHDVSTIVELNSAGSITSDITALSTSLQGVTTIVELNSAGWGSGTSSENLEFLPLSGGNMTGPVYFGQARISQGNVDTYRGGASGVSLVCSVDYDFNWQAGWITAYQQNRETPTPLYIDSGAGTSVKIWNGGSVGGGGEGVEISHQGITLPANGYIKDSENNTWEFTTSGNLVLPPSGDILNNNLESVLLKKWTTQFTVPGASNEPCTQVFAHNLGTRNVMIQCYGTENGADLPFTATRLDSLSASIYFPGNDTTRNYTLIFIG
jgi:hypothetical protein